MSPLSVWNRITGFFKRAFIGGGRGNSAFETYSKFKHFFEKMDKDDPLYPSVRQAASLCDDALRIAKQRIRLSGKLNDLDEKLTELEYFNNLTDEETQELKRLLDHFVSLTSERSMLLNQLSDFDKSLVEMFTLEDDATLAMPQIVDAEKHQRALRQDVSYLHGEKEELVDERDDMGRTLLFLHRFTVGMVATFLVVSVALTFLYIFGGMDIFLPTTILILLVMVIVTLLYLFRRRVRYEIRHNLRKQHRAVELLNKKNVLYAYYTNYLRYSYNKYKVKNARMLETNLKDFGNYKYIVGRIDTVRNLMYETEERIERFLREKNLTFIKATIEGFARTVNLEDKKRFYNELKTEKTSAEAELSELDARHEEIWETLMVLNDRDRSLDHIIEAILSTYLSEAAQLLDRIDTDPAKYAAEAQKKSAASDQRETTSDGEDEEQQ